jgi:hypothetical protein
MLQTEEPAAPEEPAAAEEPVAPEEPAAPVVVEGPAKPTYKGIGIWVSRAVCVNRRAPRRQMDRSTPHPPTCHPAAQLPLASFPSAEEADAIAAAVSAAPCLDGALNGVVVGPAPAPETADPATAAVLDTLATAGVSFAGQRPINLPGRLRNGPKLNLTGERPEVESDRGTARS